MSPRCSALPTAAAAAAAATNVSPQQQQYDLMEDDGVLVLGAHNFEAVTERFVLMLVLLYTPGCDGCAALMEEYVQASDDLYEHLIPAAKVSQGWRRVWIALESVLFTRRRLRGLCSRLLPAGCRLVGGESEVGEREEFRALRLDAPSLFIVAVYCVAAFFRPRHHPSFERLPPPAPSIHLLLLSACLYIRLPSPPPPRYPSFVLTCLLSHHNINIIIVIIVINNNNTTTSRDCHQQVDCFLQAELCQHPRWNHTPASKPTDTSTTATAATTADASPQEGGDGDEEGPFFSGGGKGAPRLFVVREGDVFAYGGELPFRAFDMVEFTKELAGIGSEEIEAADDEVRMRSILFFARWTRQALWCSTSPASTRLIVVDSPVVAVLAVICPTLPGGRDQRVGARRVQLRPGACGERRAAARVLRALVLKLPAPQATVRPRRRRPRR